MKRLCSSSVSAEGKLEITFSDSELNYNQDARVFDLVKWREEEASWEELEEIFKEMAFDSESISNLKKLLDIILFEDGNQG